ncbi:MAG: N-glycosylase/DNA lyase [Candidatus Aenigmatarchaeota archaeon]
MQALVSKINALKRSDVSKIVRERIKEFKSVPTSRWFSELCFCILTANSTAKKGIEIQQSTDFNLTEKNMAKHLKKMGHRFPNARAEFICNAPMDVAKQLDGKTSREAREWLADNVKGIGMKEASHFLRNVGYDDVAIIDRHILNVLSEHGVIEKPKTLSKKRYEEIEEKLVELGRATDLSLAELDLYLWYMKTGIVLK